MSNTKIVLADSVGELPGFRAFAEHIPATFESAEDVLFAQRNTIKRMQTGVDYPDKCVVKRFKKPNIIQQLAYSFFVKNKAKKAFCNAVELKNRGIETPEAYACVEVYAGLLIKEYYFISTEHDASPIADGILVYGNAPFDTVMAEQFGAFVASLHEKGVLHHDLNSTNVRCEKGDDGKCKFALIDINRMTFYPQGSSIPMTECIENLTRFTGRLDVFAYVARHYAIARGLDADNFVSKAVARKKRHDYLWRLRKRITHPFRR